MPPITLSRPTRRAPRLALVGALLGAALAGCVKQPEVVQSPTRSTVAAASVLDLLDEREVQGGGEVLDAEIAAALDARNLEPAPVDPVAFGDAFAARRATSHRMSWMAGARTEALLLLVEGTPDYISQVQGRFRWTVAVHVTVAPRGDLEAGLTRSFDVPVFLNFYHQQEPEALEAAAPVIAQQVGSALDEYLGGLE